MQLYLASFVLVRASCVDSFSTKTKAKIALGVVHVTILSEGQILWNQIEANSLYYLLLGEVTFVMKPVYENLSLSLNLFNQ